MKHSVKTGFSFGLTSGIITTLGLMVGLHSGTHSQLAIIGGILTIAIADAFSDALGIHISEESRNAHRPTEIWEATLATFATKFIVALSFVVPVLLLPLTTAIVVSILWGPVVAGRIECSSGKSAAYSTVEGRHGARPHRRSGDCPHQLCR